MLDYYNKVQSPITVSHLNLNVLHSKQELITIPTEAEVRSTIQISFRTQDPHEHREDRCNPESTPYPRSTMFSNRSMIYRKNQSKIRAFFKSKFVDHKSFSPSSEKTVAVI